MGRQEKAVDPAAGPVQQFASELRKLRQEAGGLPYRQMAKGVGYSVTALSQAAAGARLPSLPVAMAYAQACGGDAEEWEQRWCTAAQQEADHMPAAAEDDASSPYRGLSRFEPGDEKLFFGRDHITAELVELVGRHRFTMLFGPSGSGKSSLLRAGLIPRLADPTDQRLCPAALRILTPGAHPLRIHSRVLTPAEADGDTWLIVDQFEELFTLCHDLDERAEFIATLLSAQAPESRLRVVVGVRADFYGRCLEHEGLASVVREASLPVSPMTSAELREAIIKPAAAAGLIVERALTARLVEEVSAEPGGLPLLSHALLETWHRRRGRTLTLEAYGAAGGIRGAIAQSAEQLYTRLTPQEAGHARRVLLRLITPGDGTQDTRRPIDSGELDFADPDDISRVLTALAAARLITLDSGIVDLAHEALITAWPRLHAWIDEERDRLRTQRLLTEAARTWDALSQDSGALYRGVRLAAAEELLDEPGQLTSLERSFVSAGRAARAREQHRRQWLLVTLTGLVVLALVAGGIAWQQSRTSDRQRQEAEARRIAAVATGMRSSDPITAMRLSLASWKLADTTETRSALMGAMTQKEQGTFRIPGIDTEERNHHLIDNGRRLVSVGNDRIRVWDLPTGRQIATYRGVGDQKPLGQVLFSSDGRTLAMSVEDGVRLWDVRAGRALGTLPEVTPSSWTFSSSGRLLAIDGQDTESVDEDNLERPLDGLTEIWDVTSRRTLLRLTDPGGRAPVSSMAMSPDDGRLAVCREQRPLEVWDIRKKRRITSKTKVTCGDGQVRFTPDGRRLVLATGTGLQVWDVASGKEHARIGATEIATMYMSADGAFVAATVESEILVWRLSAPDTPVFRYPLVNEWPGQLAIDVENATLRFVNAGGSAVRTLGLGRATDKRWQQHPLAAGTLSADGEVLAAVRERGSPSLDLVETRTGRTRGTGLGKPCPKRSEECFDHVAFSADGRLVAHARGWGNWAPDDPSPVRITVGDVPTGRVRTHVDVPGAGLKGMAFGPDGNTLIVFRTSMEHSLEFWDIAQGKRTKTLLSHSSSRFVARDDGKKLVSDGGDVVDLPSGKVTRRVLTSDTIGALAFSPDGTYLAVGDEAGGLTLWDGEVRKQVGALPGIYSGTKSGRPEILSALAFSADSRLLAVAGDNGTVHVWDVASSQLLGSALPGAGDVITSLAFSADGRNLYAAGWHVPLQKHDIDPASLAVQVCRRAGSGLSRADWATYLPGMEYRDVC